MKRELLNELHHYFSLIGQPSEKEVSLLSGITAELPYFPITYISREDILKRGYDTSQTSDQELINLASEMSDSYCEKSFWSDMQYHLDHHSDIKLFDEDIYVLVEFPRDGSYFELNNIGFMCCNSEDNGARYIPSGEYAKHFAEVPEPNQLYLPVLWPKWQMLKQDDRWEAINEDKALDCFGSPAYWIPNEQMLATKDA